MIRKVQEKKERGREGCAANVRDVRDYDYGVQESGTVETVDEKEIVERRVQEEKKKKNEDVKVLTESVRSISL